MARTIFTAMINGKESKFKLKNGKFYKISPSGEISSKPHTGQGLLQLKSAARKMQGSSTKQMMDYYNQVPSSTKATVSSTGAGTAKKRPGTEIKEKTSKANKEDVASSGTRGKATKRLSPAMAQNKRRMEAMRKDANMMSPKPKAVPVPKKKPAEPKKKPAELRVKKEVFSALMSDVLKPKGKVDQSKNRPPKQEIKPTSTQAKLITAGPNVGFGPKGNIFPSNAAERRELMAKFGGTGSAAAKAAAAGKTR